MSARRMRKVCLMGDFAVGKTSLVRRFVDDQFSDRYLATVGVKISRKAVSLDAEGEVQLVVWDVEGTNSARSYPASYLRGVAGAVLVADVTRPDTIAALENHALRLREQSPEARLFVALNKVDLVEQTDSACELVGAAVRELIEEIVLTSALSGEQVESLFVALARATTRDPGA